MNRLNWISEEKKQWLVKHKKSGLVLEILPNQEEIDAPTQFDDVWFAKFPDKGGCVGFLTKEVFENEYETI